MLAWISIVLEAKNLNCWPSLIFTNPMLLLFKKQIDSFIVTSDLFPETYPYSVYRKDRNLHGVGVMLHVHKDIQHMPITELENNSESVWVKVFANKTSHYVASWYRQPNGTSEDFQLVVQRSAYPCQEPT